MSSDHSDEGRVGGTVGGGGTTGPGTAGTGSKGSEELEGIIGPVEELLALPCTIGRGSDEELLWPSVTGR